MLQSNKHSSWLQAQGMRRTRIALAAEQLIFSPHYDVADLCGRLVAQPTGPHDHPLHSAATGPEILLGLPWSRSIISRELAHSLPVNITCGWNQLVGS